MSWPAGRSADVAIVGGGIVGTAAAAFLARAGARVVLYERTAIAAGASGRNSGVIQQPHDPILAALYHESLAAYRALDAISGGALGLGAEPAGLLHIGRDPGVVTAIAEAWRATDPATRPEVLDGADLRRLEPSLAADLVACRLRIGYPVAPAAATLAFAAEAERAGATFVEGEEVLAASRMASPSASRSMASSARVARSSSRAGPGHRPSSTRPGPGDRSSQVGASSPRSILPMPRATSSRKPVSTSSPTMAGMPPTCRPMMASISAS